MEQISNTHTGYIHKLITNLSFYFFEMTWQFEISVIPLIIGGTSILIIVCKQSVLTGIICIFISAIAVYLKYKMIKNKQKYQKKVNEAESKYNATFVDFIQNIIAVRKLNIDTEAIPGFASGMIIFPKTVNTLPPSIYVASSSSLGIPSTNPLIINVE